MQRYFLEVKQFIEHDPRYAVFIGNISGANYPPPPQHVWLSNIMSFVWLAGLFLLLAGDNIFVSLGIPEPELFTQAKKNKMYVLFALFMLNNFANGALATGAFEIYIDDTLVFSKLKSGHLPSAEDVHSFMQGFGLE